MAENGYTPEDLRALELYHQLVNLSPADAGKAVMLTLRLPSGRYVGDVWLSAEAAEGLIDGAIGLNAVRDCSDEAPQTVGDDLDEHFAEAMKIVSGPERLPEPTKDSIDDVVAGFEALLRGEGGRA